MDSRPSVTLGVVLGLVMGGTIGVGYGDPVTGSVIGVCWALGMGGSFALSEDGRYGVRLAGPRWHLLVWAFGGVAMLTAVFGSVLSQAPEIPAILLLGGLWAGGVYAGIVLERSMAHRGDSDPSPAHDERPGAASRPASDNDS